MLIDHRRHREILGGQLAPGDVPRDFMGVHLTRDGLSNIVMAAGAFIQDLDWVPGDYDIGGWLGSSGDTSVTVPAGVRFVRLSYAVVFTGAYAAGDAVLIDPRTDLGGLQIPYARAVYKPGNGVVNSHCATSAAMPVTPGDKLRLSVFNLRSSVQTTFLAGVGTNLGVEAVTLGV